ncbi:MAG: hypothetical protein JSS63_06040 [Bacteroidetes bacterium]|nr:hypothetical protein [Bacteroidota bacterium]
MYRNLLNADLYNNINASEVIRDIFILGEAIKQERDDFRQNKVKEVKMILDYGKDSAKKDFALMKINIKGFIQEYIPKYSNALKSPMKFFYDDAERLTEITGTTSDKQKEFSWYRFLYYDRQLQKFIKWQGSQFPQEYELTYSGDENQFLYISSYNAYDKYYFHFSADFNKENKITGLYSVSSFGESRIYYSGTTNENSLNGNSLDTIMCTKGSLTKYYIMKNNRMLQRIAVMEEFISKRTVPREEYERIYYYYGTNNLLERIESSVRDFPVFNLYFEYEYYE